MNKGGPNELEQMGSADPPLAVHGLYGGGHRQHRCHSREEVHGLRGPVGGDPARVSVFHRSVLVRAAVCHKVAQRATHQLNGRPSRHNERPCPSTTYFGTIGLTRYSNKKEARMKGLRTKKELSPEQREELLRVLKARFEKNMNRHEGLEWAQVKAKLQAHHEKLWSLSEMERTGGEPDVVGYDK